MKRFRAETSEFLDPEKELQVGEAIELRWKSRNGEYAAKGRVTKRRLSMLIGKHNAYELNVGNGEKIHVKMQILGGVPATEKNDAVALAALSGAEIYGYNDTLKGEAGPLLVRISVQRHLQEAKNPKQYLRAAAIARNVPRVLKTNHIVSDLGPENIGTHTYDIYITPRRLHDIDDQIMRMKSIQHFLERYGAKGLQALAEIHETLGNRKYAERLQQAAERYEKEQYLDVGDYKVLIQAFKSALRDYPKTDEFWHELHKDIIVELSGIKRRGVRGKTVQNVENYAKRTLLRKGVDWKSKIFHATIINKNLTKLWLYAMKRKGIIRFQNEGAPQRRAGPSRRL